MPSPIDPGPMPAPVDTADLEPDTARTYERAKPMKEYGVDQLDCDPAGPCHAPDLMIRSVRNAHSSSNHICSDSALDAGASCPIE